MKAILFAVVALLVVCVSADQPKSAGWKLENLSQMDQYFFKMMLDYSIQQFGIQAGAVDKKVGCTDFKVAKVKLIATQDGQTPMEATRVRFNVDVVGKNGEKHNVDLVSVRLAMRDMKQFLYYSINN